MGSALIVCVNEGIRLEQRRYWAHGNHVRDRPELQLHIESDAGTGGYVDPFADRLLEPCGLDADAVPPNHERPQYVMPFRVRRRVSGGTTRRHGGDDRAGDHPSAGVAHAAGNHSLGLALAGAVG